MSIETNVVILKTNTPVVSYDEQISAINEVNEPLSVYVKNIGNLSGKISFADFFLDKMLIIQAIRRGLPYQIFNQIKAFTPFTDADWAEYLDLSTKSLQRYRDDKNFTFKPIHTEKIFELAEVTNFGIEVFGSSEKFYAWLNTPTYALNGYKPGELLKDSYGKELVMAELNRIEHGIFA